MVKETSTQRKRRLEKKKQKRKEKLKQESEENIYLISAKRCKRDKEVPKKQRNVENKNDKEKMFQARANETADKHISRLAIDKLRHAKIRAIETSEAHISRLKSDRLKHSELRARGSSQKREARLRRQREAYAQRLADDADFHLTINTFCDMCCDICQKKCYPNQVVKYRLISQKPYLPPELSTRNDLLVCRRCNTHLKSSKNYASSKAYWNNLLPGKIPDEIDVLTEVERRLLQRIIPYDT